MKKINILMLWMSKVPVLSRTAVLVIQNIESISTHSVWKTASEHLAHMLCENSNAALLLLWRDINANTAS